MPDPSHYDHYKPEYYFDFYAEVFGGLRERDIRLLELGVYKGGSLEFWRDYFPRGTIVGIDQAPVQLDDPSGRIRIFQGAQQDLDFLDKVAAETAPAGFDIIIDDCSHVGHLARACFHHLFSKHLKPGGFYALEDWGTGYWPHWPDGGKYRPPATVPSHNPGEPPVKRFPSHDYGMVGFLKELVDECAMSDITHPDKGGCTPFRRPRIKKLLIAESIAVVHKAATAHG